MHDSSGRSGRRFTQPPFGIFLALLAVLAALTLAWLAPDLVWGRWRSTGWDPAPHRQSAPLNASDGALLDSSQAVALAHQCSRPGPAVVRRPWTPSPDDIRQLEADLAPMLRLIDDTLTTPAQERRISLTTYRRQYAGLELETGERVIYVNALHPAALSGLARDGSDTTRWLREPINVCDGWRAFWGIEYNPLNRRFRGFAFNGKA